MSVNVERLRAEPEFITANPERWDQEVWAMRSGCGTTHCIAGWTVVHASITVAFGQDRVWADQTSDGRLIEDVARELLGLTFCEAECLFWPDNTLEDLWNMAVDFTDGAIQIPASPTEEVAS